MTKLVNFIPLILLLANTNCNSYITLIRDRNMPWKGPEVRLDGNSVENDVKRPLRCIIPCTAGHHNNRKEADVPW